MGMSALAQKRTLSLVVRRGLCGGNGGFLALFEDQVSRSTIRSSMAAAGLVGLVGLFGRGFGRFGLAGQAAAQLAGLFTPVVAQGHVGAHFALENIVGHRRRKEARQMLRVFSFPPYPC